MTPFDRELEKYHSDKEDINYNLDKEKEFYAKLMLNSIGDNIKNELSIKPKLTLKQKIKRKIIEFLSK